LNYLNENKEKREKLLESYKSKLVELQAQLAELQP
jgi:hypothetical protein